MSNESGDSASAPRKKQSELHDLPPNGLTESEAADISGGLTLEPCLRNLIPCVKPAIDPCWRPARLPDHNTPGH